MSAAPLAKTDLVAGIPALRLLEGLARIYQLVLVADREGHIRWMSDQLGMLCGSAEQQVGRSTHEILARFPKPGQVFAIRSQLRDRGVSSNMRVELNRKEGGTLPVEVSILEISSDDPSSPLFVLIARPFERDDSAGELSSQTRRIEHEILNGSPNSSLLIDPQGFVEYANPAFEKLVGSDPAEIVGKPIAMLVDSPLDLENLIATLQPGKEVHEHELGLRCSDGTTARVFASAFALRADGGNVAGTVLNLRGAGERPAELVAIEQKNAELEHCVQALAHDLRSPLVALMGFSRLLRQDYGNQMDDTGIHFLDRIEQAGRTMEALIHALLELSRIGQPGERRTMVDPRAVLLQVGAELKPRLESGGMRLTLPVQPPLLYCDGTRLYQIFCNLIGNAIDHMGACEDPHIQVEIVEDCGAHRITVRDGGRGIAPEHHTRIFEVFQSLRSTSEGHRGSGIGLAIVKKIADTHSGRAWVESTPGKGAAFHVTFPAR